MTEQGLVGVDVAHSATKEGSEEGGRAKQEQREHKKRQRARRKDEHEAVCANVVARCRDLIGAFPLCALPRDELGWEDMPPSLSPRHNLLGERADNKQQQCVSFARALQQLLPNVSRRILVVDFGSGSGNASLPLTWWFRDRCDFVLVDRFDEPIRIARERVAAAGLSHVRCVVSLIRDLPKEHFDVGFSSHACGLATDHALLACLEAGASFCLTSCCVGKLKAEDGATVLPHSQAMRKLASRDEFLALARAGDHDCNAEWSQLKSECKLCLEADRLSLAAENGGYQRVWRTRLDPPTCSPKNDVVMGLRRDGGSKN